MTRRIAAWFGALPVTARRAVTIPLVIGVELLLVGTAPLSLAVSTVVSLALRSSRPLRSTALVVAYAVIELSVLRRLLDGSVRDGSVRDGSVRDGSVRDGSVRDGSVRDGSVRDGGVKGGEVEDGGVEDGDWDAFLRDVLTRAHAALARILDVRVVLEDGSATPEQLRSCGPLIVLARHCGPGDSLFIAWLLAVHYRLRLRVVLTSLLRLEPAVDLAGDHLPLCFVGHRRAGALTQITRCASALKPGDALLIFPEGGNFTRARWRKAVSSLTGSARRARRRTHTLPPRLGGTLAALRGAPDAAVLLLEHTGFADDGRERPLWRLPVHRTLVIRTVLMPAGDVPRDRPGVERWLDASWARVDSWVAHHAVS